MLKAFGTNKTSSRNIVRCLWFLTVKVFDFFFFLLDSLSLQSLRLPCYNNALETECASALKIFPDSAAQAVSTMCSWAWFSQGQRQSQAFPVMAACGWAGLELSCLVSHDHSLVFLLLPDTPAALKKRKKKSVKTTHPQKQQTHNTVHEGIIDKVSFKNR